MDSETPQTKEIDNKTDEGKATENDQEEAKDTAIAGGTEGAQEGGGGHDDKNDSDTAADMEEDAGDLVTVATAPAIIDDTKEQEGEKYGGGDSSPQAERDTDASDEAKKDEDTSESDAQKVQSEPETTEKVPLDMDEGETGEEKEKEEGLQYKVRFDVSGDPSTEAAGDETKVDPTAAAATDAEQGVSTPTKQPLPSTESGRKFLEPSLNFFQYCTAHRKSLGGCINSHTSGSS